MDGKLKRYVHKPYGVVMQATYKQVVPFKGTLKSILLESDATSSIALTSLFIIKSLYLCLDLTERTSNEINSTLKKEW